MAGVRARRAWTVLRIVALAIWLVAAAGSWWQAPRRVDFAEARADLAAGRVVAYEWADHWADGGSRRWFGGSVLRQTGKHGPLFAWRIRDGRMRWTDTREFTGDSADAGAAQIAADLRVVRAEGRESEVGPTTVWIGALGVALVFLSLVVLVGGPAPALGTRWFWFWLICLAPYGLGAVFWLIRDRPWAWPDVDGKRDRGLLGLGLGILAALLVGLLLSGLHEIAGDRWIPISS